MSGHQVFRGEYAIVYKSTLERDYIVRTEFFLNVLDITAQPVEVEYEQDGVARLYTPTFLVHRRLGDREYPRIPKPLLVEVIHRKRWQGVWRKSRARWRAALRVAAANGWQFRIQDESRIRDPVLSRIQGLARYKGSTIDEHLSKRILDDLDSLETATVSCLVSRHFDRDNRVYGTRHVWSLLARRLVDCDISRPLDNATELWIPTDG